MLKEVLPGGLGEGQRAHKRMEAHTHKYPEGEEEGKWTRRPQMGARARNSTKREKEKAGQQKRRKVRWESGGLE